MQPRCGDWIGIYFEQLFGRTVITMRNAGLDEAQAGIKIAGRNISYLSYAYNNTLMAESKEELKSLLI